MNTSNDYVVRCVRLESDIVTVYELEPQLKQGKIAELMLDEMFQKWYEISQVSRDTERAAHVDRVFTSPDGRELLVEYKADFRGAQTGNAYIEIVSVDVAAKPGWVYSSMADVLVYWIVDRKCLAIKMSKVRRCLERWQTKYAVKGCKNKSYSSRGILVPVSELEHIAIWQKECVMNGRKSVMLPESQETTILCKECKLSPPKLVVKTNRRSRSQFLGCPNYPECRHTEAIPESLYMKALGQDMLFEM